MFRCFIMELKLIDQTLGQRDAGKFCFDQIIRGAIFVFFISLYTVPDPNSVRSINSRTIFMRNYLVQAFAGVFPALELGRTKIISFLWSKRVNKQSL